MREYVDLSGKWSFTKRKYESLPDTIEPEWDIVNLPHTWNAIDGTDGGNDYFRGKCIYAKILNKNTLPIAEKYFLEVGGANSVAEIFINGKKLLQHEGGYSLFRCDITSALSDGDDLLIITVDNSENNAVYPMMADFTFYGGLYRYVRIIATDSTHFELLHYGTPAIKVTPNLRGSSADIEIEVFTERKHTNDKIRYSVYDAEGKEVANETSGGELVNLKITEAKRWHGVRSPYLYVAKAELVRGGEIIDTVSTRFGIREFSIDPERGFILNGEDYPLHGVSRHQDRQNFGNALLPEHHREDIALILEMGATAVRLAHYQHSEEFYSLCDEKGLIVWAEIPYISRHRQSADKNSEEQMIELVTQNYNHPSIVIWGLSNEITMGGEADSSLIENHKRLNTLCHSLDKTRKTGIAALSTCPTDAEYLRIPDVVGYNHYFGWYGGDVSENGEWFDSFHRANPDIPICCTEYGAEALNFHTGTPIQGDYTEEYQSYYHEEMISQLYKRKYIFATFVWNMFDFGADAREEGGEHGQNHKGLITFDRKYKKDSFYAYKAQLSDEPFVHICAKRYRERTEDITKVKVYSNQKCVELFANGRFIDKKTSESGIFIFDVPLSATVKVTARSGMCEDEATFKKADKPNESYILREGTGVLNWFDIPDVDGHLTIKDKIADIRRTSEGNALLSSVFSEIFKSGSTEFAGFEMNEAMTKMMSGFTLLRLFGMLGSMAGVKLSKNELLEINKRLNRIKKAD